MNKKALEELRDCYLENAAYYRKLNKNTRLNANNDSTYCKRQGMIKVYKDVADSLQFIIDDYKNYNC